MTERTFQPNMADHLLTGEVSLQKHYQMAVVVWSAYAFIITINECFLPMNFIERDSNYFKLIINKLNNKFF